MFRVENNKEIMYALLKPFTPKILVIKPMIVKAYQVTDDVFTDGLFIYNKGDYVIEYENEFKAFKKDDIENNFIPYKDVKKTQHVENDTIYSAGELLDELD